jgi:prophage antirepressor-like protein
MVCGMCCSKDVRTIKRDGEPWFVAKDVAEILGYTNPQKAVRDHCRCPESVGVNESFTLDRQTIIIREGDVYRLIFKSRLPASVQFEEFVMGEVLPTIRKTDRYDVKQ